MQVPGGSGNLEAASRSSAWWPAWKRRQAGGSGWSAESSPPLCDEEGVQVPPFHRENAEAQQGQGTHPHQWTLTSNLKVVPPACQPAVWSQHITNCSASLPPHWANRGDVGRLEGPGGSQAAVQVKALGACVEPAVRVGSQRCPSCCAP